MLAPKRRKFSKCFKGRIHGHATRNHTLAFGSFGLKALEPALMTARQIEAARRAMTRCLKRLGRVWIRVYPDKPITKKPAETRMGSGKGSVEAWVAVVKPGNILYEVSGVPSELAQQAFALASSKLPILTKVVTAETYR